MKTPSRHAFALLALTALVALTGCSTTRFTTTWKAPGAQRMHLAPGAKVGALVIHPDVTIEHAGEDALAAELTKRGLHGIPAYSILGDSDVRNEEAARAAFAKAGAVAVVVMRGISAETEVDYRAPSYYAMPPYNGFWGGYYDTSWDMAYSPGYLQTSKVVTVETLLYDLRSNKLIWAGRSRTVDPTRLGSFIREVVDEAAKEMKKDGVI